MECADIMLRAPHSGRSAHNKISHIHCSQKWESVVGLCSITTSLASVGQFIELVSGSPTFLFHEVLPDVQFVEVAQYLSAQSPWGTPPA